MDGKFIMGLLAKVFGREPKDEVDAATMAAELKVIRESHDTLTADLATSVSKATGLTEQLGTATKTISEMETADADRIAAGKGAQVDAALAAGKIGATQVEWAKANFEAFLSLIDGVEDGTFAPPKGRQVPDEVIAGADSTNLTGDQKTALDAEVHAHLKAHPELKGHYGNAWLAVTKEREAAAGKGV
jgi:hypothetical protein